MLGHDEIGGMYTLTRVVVMLPDVIVTRMNASVYMGSGCVVVENCGEIKKKLTGSGFSSNEPMR